MWVGLCQDNACKVFLQLRTKSTEIVQGSKDFFLFNTLHVCGSTGENVHVNPDILVSTYEHSLFEFDLGCRKS